MIECRKCGHLTGDPFNHDKNCPANHSPASAGSAAQRDERLREVAESAYLASLAWADDVRLIGNCRAADLQQIFREYLLIKEEPHNDQADSRTPNP